MARAYRDWAEMVYAFWNGTMTDATTGAVTDHYATTGNNHTCTKSVNEAFTYNEGLMLGAATVLGHGADAARFASRLTTAHVKNGSPAGPPVLYDNCEGSCSCCDCQSFKGVAARELSRWLGSPLAAQHPALKASAAQVLADSAAAVWNNARGTGPHGPLFSARWAECAGCTACGYEAAGHTSTIFALLTQV